MEPSAKRRKTLNVQEAEDEDDELFMEPDELNRIRDPEFRLQQRRDRAARKLKSRFEDIFAKYGRDFEGVGDEVDIISGEIVVDNGHMESLKAVEFGDSDDGEDDDDDDDDAESTGQEDQGALQSANDTSKTQPHFDPTAFSHGESHPTKSNLLQKDISNPPSLSSLLGRQNSYPTPFSSSDSPEMQPPRISESIWQAPELSSTFGQSSSADPTWQAPELPPSAFLLVSNRQGQTISKITKKSFPVAHDSDADEQDNLFDANPGGTETQKESPLIKKFPAVDSSPNDNSYSDLIKEVIENLPPTPPDMRRMRTLKSLGKPSPLGQETITKKKQSATKCMEDTRISQAKKSLTAEDAASSLALPDRGPLNSVHESLEEALWKDTDLELFVDVTGVDVRTSSSPQIFVDINILTQQQGQDEPVGSSQAIKNKGQAKTAERSENDRMEVKTLQKPTGRNILDPDFAFSDEDEETLLPRRSRPSAIGVATPVALPTKPPEEPSAPQEENNEQPGREPEAPKAQRGRPRSRRDGSKVSQVSVQTRATKEQKQISSTGTLPQEATGKSRPRRVKKQGPSEVHAQNELVEHTSDIDPSPTVNHRQPSPELGDLVNIAQDEKPAQPAPEPRPQDQPRLAPEPIQTRPRAATQPKTPKDSTKIPTTPVTATSLISLLSDGEDDEDEISFNLSDFTPSGHHRVLVHRPFLPQPSSTKSSSPFSIGNDNRRRYSIATITTTTKIPTEKSKRVQKQKRSSLPGGSRSIDSVRNSFKTPPSTFSIDESTTNLATAAATVGPNATGERNQDPQKQKHDTNTPRKTKKRKRLAHSVVRVQREADDAIMRMIGRRRDNASPSMRGLNNGGYDHDRDRQRRETLSASPTASIIQTPGGSRRRCGDDGWQCQRDFCFVCM